MDWERKNSTRPTILAECDLGATLTIVQYVPTGAPFKGSQRYAIPAGVDLAKYPSVIIWCERFGVLISPADLKTAQIRN